MTKRKDGLWQQQMTVIEDGRKIQKCFYGKTKKEVLEKIAAYKYAQKNGKLFDTVADEWYNQHEVAYKTKESYRAPLRRAKQHFSGAFIKEITPAMINASVLKIADAGFSRRTVQMHLDVLRMIFNYAIVSGDCASNPVDPVDIPRGLTVTHRELPEETDIQKITSYVDSDFGLFPFFLLYSGLRRGELLALTWDDIDFANKTIRIDKSVSYQNNKPVIKSTKTNAGFRTVVLLDILAEKLTPGTGYVFGGESPLTHTQFVRRWDKYVSLTGIKFTPHQLRHEYATILYDAGIDDKSAQQLLGHSSIVVTRNIYTHITESRKNSTADKLNMYLSCNESGNA